MDKANSNTLKIDDPVNSLPGVGDQVAQKLARLKIFTIRDLLELIPHRLEDRSQLVTIKTLRPDQSCVISGEVEAVHSRRSQRGVLIIDAKIRDQSGTISALWFNQRYLLGQLRVGQVLTLFGEKRLAKSLGNPFFVKKIIARPEIVPIYPATSGLNQAAISRLIAAAWPLIADFPDIVPDSTRERYQLPTRSQAIADCHFSRDQLRLDQARQLLAFEELLVLATEVLLAKQERRHLLGSPLPINPEELKQIVATLPFELTDGQRRVTWQIIQDLAQSHPMYRLLYGEVGSGKTAVAAIVSAAVCRNHQQAIWLLPTAILAVQQAETLQPIARALGLKLALLTASRKDDHLDADIIVGTHALLEPKVKFKRPGLIVIDEQHRFGVEQRDLLIGRYPTTHLLMMSATPIPRSLAQTVFGHLDVTYLNERPPGRQEVKTVVFDEANRQRIEQEIETMIEQGQSGFVICPLIDAASSPSLTTLFSAERKAVKAEASRLAARFPSARIGIIHGRVKAEERERVITEFKNGRIDILLATTVVEVGIDNPLASWILIEEADRFGLATLHQLRGRVGRGGQTAVCYLAQSVDSDSARARLEVMTESNDGLAIAEADLELRGPGELIGFEQSGLPELKFASLSDLKMISNCFAAAEEILQEGLEHHPELARLIVQRRANRLNRS